MSGRQSPFPLVTGGLAAPSRKRLCGTEQGSPGSTQGPVALSAGGAGPAASSSLSTQHRKRGPLHPQSLAGWPASQASPGMRGEGPRVLWSTARRASTDQHAPEPARGVREPGLARGAGQTAATSLHAGPLFLILRSRT